MTADTIQTTAVDEAAARRVVPYEYNPSLPLMPGHRYPRWRVALRPREEVVALLTRAQTDYKALIRQMTADYKVELVTIQGEWATGTMTPLARAQRLTSAEQRRASREARIEAAFADLTEERVIERNEERAQAAMTRVWRATQDGHTGTRDGPSAA